MPLSALAACRPPRGAALLAAAVLASLLATGCVQRRMTIRSNPPGALVFVDDQEIGYTPCSTPFTYYGVRKIQLIKDGYETTTVKQDFQAPWYQIPPLDFVSENFSFRETRDERVLDFQLSPQQIVPSQPLIDRAEQLRLSAQQGTITPLLTPAPPPGRFPIGVPGGITPSAPPAFPPPEALPPPGGP